MNSTYFRLNILALSFLSSVLHAQDELVELYGGEEMIAISTGTQKPIYQAPSVANVITSDDIRNLGATTLEEVLESVPGLHVSYSSVRGESLFEIRGFGNTSFNSVVLTLINGISADTALDGGRPNGFRMPVENIDRIEIIRGPGSAVYGADAFAGVINIITKSASTSSGTNLGGRAGSFGTREVWFNNGSSFGNWDFYFGINHQRTDGDDKRIVESDLQSGFDFLFGTSASLAPGPLESQYEVTDIRLDLQNNNLNLQLSHVDIGDAGQGTGVAQALDDIGVINSSVSTANLIYRNDKLVENWEFKVVGSYSDIEGEPDYQILPPGSTVLIGADGNLFTPPNENCPEGGCVVTFSDGMFGNPYMYEEHSRFEFIGLFRGLDDHVIRLSIGGEEQDLEVTSTQNFGPGVIDGTQGIIDGVLTDVTGTPNIYVKDGEQSRSLRFISIQDEWSLSNDWDLTTGIRYDDFSDFGDTINPRLALVWQTRYNLTSKLLYARAFRAPSFLEQFGQNNPVTLGNEDVEPETIDTVELAFDFRPSLDSQIIFNTFIYDADDIIQFVRQENGNSVATNTSGQKGRGIEIELNVDVTSDFNLYANYSMVDAVSKITDEPVPDVPTRQVYVSASYNIGQDMSLNTQLNWVGNRKRLRSDPNDISVLADGRPTISNNTSVDINFRYVDLFDHFDIGILVKNAFDHQLFEPSPAPNVAIPGDFPIAGRSVFFEVVTHY